MLMRLHYMLIQFVGPIGLEPYDKPLYFYLHSESIKISNKKKRTNITLYKAGQKVKEGEL